MSTLGIGLIFDLFHDIGQVCVRRDKFQIWLRIGVKISACSFQTQKGMPSGPVAVRVMLLRLFQTSLSGILSTSNSLPTTTSTGAMYFRSVQSSWKQSFRWLAKVLSNTTGLEWVRRCVMSSIVFYQPPLPTGAARYFLFSQISLEMRLLIVAN